MQPALILAILTFSNLMRSSTAELGEEGMRRTFWLKEKAQAALEAAVAVNVIDPDLAQAAWVRCFSAKRSIQPLTTFVAPLCVRDLISADAQVKQDQVCP